MERNQKPDIITGYYQQMLQTEEGPLLDWFVSHSRIVRKKKGTILFRPEATVPFTAFLLDGIVKTYILSSDGTENTFAIYYKPGFPLVATKDMINIPGIWCKTLTDVTYIEMSGPGPYDLAPKFPELYPFLLQGIQPVYVGAMDKLRAATVMTAKERYLWFLKKYPALADRLPQVEVALFLGIQPQSLSRIRNELFEEEASALSEHA